MIKYLHPVAGALAILIIATFWISTVISELLGSQSTVVAVKTAIPWGFLLLIPAIAIAGGSGIALAKGHHTGLIRIKVKRIPLVAANGLLILIPSALFLSFKANASSFDTTFYTVQALELLAGAANITMLGLNMRDGLKMKGRRRRQAAC